MQRTHPAQSERTPDVRGFRICTAMAQRIHSEQSNAQHQKFKSWGDTKVRNFNNGFDIGVPNLRAYYKPSGRAPGLRAVREDRVQIAYQLGTDKVRYSTDLTHPPPPPAIYQPFRAV